MTADAFGGIWNHALELSRALARHDIQVELATTGARPGREQRLQAARLENVTLHERVGRSDASHDSEAAGEWLLELESLLAPDVVHANSLAYGALPCKCPILVAAHHCLRARWSALRGGELPRVYEAYDRAAAEGLHGADLVVAPTHSMLRGLERHYGPLPHGRVIPYARDPIRYIGREKEPYILAVGQLRDEAKNLGGLARVARRIPWPVYIAGEPCRDGVTGVRTLGRLLPEALARWYSAASIFVQPARYEPFGLAPLEAALCGCALVLGDLDSLREVWGDAALFVSPDDEDALRAALLSLIADSRRRAELGRRAIARALLYPPSHMAAAYAESYRALLAQHWVPARAAVSGVA